MSGEWLQKMISHAGPEQEMVRLHSDC